MQTMEEALTNVPDKLRDWISSVWNAIIAAIIPDVLANPDNIKKGEPTNKSGYETVVISKEYADGSLHVVNAILKNNVLEVYTAYVWNMEKTEKKRSAHGSVISETGSNSAIPPQ